VLSNTPSIQLLNRGSKPTSGSDASLILLIRIDWIESNPNDTWNRVKLDDKPFAKGGLRYAYYMKVDSASRLETVIDPVADDRSHLSLHRKALV